MVRLSDAPVYFAIDFGSRDFPGSRNDYSTVSEELAEFGKGTAYGIEWAESLEPSLHDVRESVTQPEFMRGFGFGAAVELSTPGTFVSADDEVDFGLGPSEPISFDESEFNTGAVLGADWVRSLLTPRPALASEIRDLVSRPLFLRGFAAGTIEALQRS